MGMEARALVALVLLCVVAKVVSLYCRGSRVCPLSKWHSGNKKQMFLLCSLLNIVYCGEHLLLRSGILSLRSPVLESRILCVEISVISFILPSSGGYYLLLFMRF